jgi:hypothetical protein
MTESTGYPGRKLPQPVFFDPTFERLPAAAAFDDAHPGPVILLYDPATDREWVADAAVAIATGWTAAGRRTVLADLSLEEPVLHERIGMGNLEGVVDIFLYGASLARSARPVPGRGFYLITAGTYTEDPGAIFRHPRWEKLVAGFREAQASLLLFVPAAADEMLSLGRWAEDVIVLGEKDNEEILRSVLLNGFSVRAWLTPPLGQGTFAPPAPAPAPAAPAPSRFPEPEPGPPRPWMAPPREAAPARDDHLPGAAEAAVAPASALPVPDPTWEEAPPAPKRRVRPFLLALLLLAALAAAAVLVYLYRPQLLGLMPPAGRENPLAGDRPAPRATVPARPAAAAAAPAQAAGVPRPYTVFAKSFDNYEAARSFRTEAAGELSGVSFYIFPELTGGVVYYKVYAGVLGDTAEAAALRQRLVDADLVSPDAVGGPSALVQQRPLAFVLGEFATQGAADSAADSLARRAIPGYVVPVPAADGSERWRLYGGAFRDSADAAVMRQFLDSAQVRAPLVPRTGRPPASSK